MNGLSVSCVSQVLPLLQSGTLSELSFQRPIVYFMVNFAFLTTHK